jgi:hypothetical protein
LKTEPKPISAERLAEIEKDCKTIVSALLYERARADAAEARLSSLLEAAREAEADLLFFVPGGGMSYPTKEGLQRVSCTLLKLRTALEVKP